MVVVTIHNADPSIPLNAIEEIIQAALDAADPYRLVKEKLKIKHHILRIGDKNIKVERESRIVVIALGKASLEMARAAVSVLGERIDQGVCICKHNLEKVSFEKFQVFESAHPIPDERSVKAANLIKEAVANLTEKDFVLLLLSGGGSSLACLPAEGILLADIQQVTGLLLKNGASINEMNIVRKHLDVFKGGGFAKMVQPANMAVLVLSDVIGSPLDVIASGPAIQDSSTFADAIGVLKRFLADQYIPPSVKIHLENGRADEIGKYYEKGSGLIAYHKIIGSNVISVDAAARKAAELGFMTEVLTYGMQGEARTASEILLKKEYPRPFALFAGGETTVTVRGDGKGGRNLEMALGAVGTVSQLKNVALVTLATDGEDGPTDAAGALISSEQKSDLEMVRQ